MAERKEFFEHPKNQDTLQNDPRKDATFHTKNTKLFEDELCQVFFTQTERFPRYFVLKPKNKNLDDFFTFRVKPFLKFLREKGFPSYTLSQQLKNHSYYIIPAPNTGKRLDINAKILNSLRCFFGESFLANFDQLPNLSEYQALEGNTDSLRYPREHVWENLDKLQKNVFGALTRVVPQHPVPDTLPKKLKRMSPACAFCNPVTIAKQLVLDLGGFLIVMNYKPYAGSVVHVMIVPSHLEDWNDLTDQQCDALATLQQAIVYSLKVNFGLKNNQLITMIQNGVTAGQTVSGIHLHILSKPKKLSFLMDIMNEMRGKPSSPLTKEEMTHTARKIRPEIVQYLLSKSGPNKFSVSEFPPTLEKPTLLKFGYPKEEPNTGFHKPNPFKFPSKML